MSTLKIEYATLKLDIKQSVEVPPAEELPAVFTRLGMNLSAQETFWVVAYSSMRNIHSIVEVARGSYNDVVVNIPAVMSAVHAAGTDRFLVVHNHPNGSLEPSAMDIKVTQRIANAAKESGLYFEDHIIIAPPDQAYSMVKMGVMVLDPRIAKERESRIRTKRTMSTTYLMKCGAHE